jgi:hypothetical protein
MRKFVSVPLIFLFLGSLLGLFLRWQFISPTPHVNYVFFLHAHSHVMFLGWTFNTLFIAFTLNHVLEIEQRSFRFLFVILQFLVLGMLISFPLQGYGFYSILFSTLHTFVAIAFIVKFFNRTKHVTSTSAWYARFALIFFLISTAGPFSLGYLISAGLSHTNWYNFSIYFYLHFQYNGFFLFGVLSLFFDLLERGDVKFNIAKAKVVGLIIGASCLPAYFLSTLWAKPGNLFYLLAGLAALFQIFGWIVLVRLIVENAKGIKTTFNQGSIQFLFIALIAFTLKLILQSMSAWPPAAQFAFELRPVVISYLHLVLLGVISLPLLVWFLESGFINVLFGKKSMVLFVLSFLGMEVCLVMYPWWSSIVGSEFPSSASLTFLFSAFLCLSCLLLLIATRRKA